MTSHAIFLLFSASLMETSGLLLLFFFFSASLPYPALSSNNCSPSTCGDDGPEIRFPFRLKTQQSYHCGYPGFDLSCDNQSQTILTLPHAGDFVVNHIDYVSQWVFINDPDFCLPKRILNFTLSGSPFAIAYSRNFTFLNCSSAHWSESMMYRSVPIYCLSTNRNFTIVAISAHYVPSSCRKISTVSVPIRSFYQYEMPMDLTDDLQLTWSVPNCGSCEVAGGTCGFEGDLTEIGCFDLPNRGLPRSAKYGVIIGIGVPFLICLFGLICYACNRIKAYGTRGRELDSELSSPTIIPQRAIILTGLDKSTIESYPMTVLGESRRLPKPNDGICPICLAEYQPKESLRGIPECNHYFHATCVDEWLRMNATCPLCRNSPEESSVVTPCSSTTSSSTILSSSSSAST
ncbi:RING-type E3 ubiquitin transferase [Sarracenia purpurea var. burkii]